MPAETHVEQAPMGREEVLALIRDRLADILEIDPSDIAEGASFADDLDADSLALIELVEGSRRSWRSVRSASASRTRIWRTCALSGMPSTTS